MRNLLAKYVTLFFAMMQKVDIYNHFTLALTALYFTKNNILFVAMTILPFLLQRVKQVLFGLIVESFAPVVKYF